MTDDTAAITELLHKYYSQRVLNYADEQKLQNKPKHIKIEVA